MTYEQFKFEMDLVRENRIVMRSLLKSLDNLTEERLSALNSGAVDYSKEPLQMSHDPDLAMIETLDRIDKDRERLQQKLRSLEEANEYYESLILSTAGIGGEVLRLYYIEGYTMEAVADHLQYDISYCWMFRKKSLKKLLEQEEKK